MEINEKKKADYELELNDVGRYFILSFDHNGEYEVYFIPSDTIVFEGKVDPEDEDNEELLENTMLLTDVYSINPDLHNYIMHECVSQTSYQSFDMYGKLFNAEEIVDNSEGHIFKITVSNDANGMGGETYYIANYYNNADDAVELLLAYLQDAQKTYLFYDPKEYEDMFNTGDIASDMKPYYVDFSEAQFADNKKLPHIGYTYIHFIDMKEYSF